MLENVLGSSHILCSILYFLILSKPKFYYVFDISLVHRVLETDLIDLMSGEKEIRVLERLVSLTGKNETTCLFL
jgi:hypothetical protein